MKTILSTLFTMLLGIQVAFAQEPVQVLPIGHTGMLKSFSFSSNGKYALSGGADKKIILWEVATGREIRTFYGHTDWVVSVAFSPPTSEDSEVGKYIVSSGFLGDKTIKIWEVASGKELGTLSGHEDAVQAVTFSPNGQLILSGSSDKTLKLWDVKTQKEVFTFGHHSHGLKYACEQACVGHSGQIFTADLSNCSIINSTFVLKKNE